jgi:hypothetical protein
MDMTLIVEDTGAVLEFERLLLHSKWQEEEKKVVNRKVHTQRSPHNNKHKRQQACRDHT